MGFYSQEYWSGLPIPSPGDLPTPGTEPGPPALQADSLPSEVILKQKQLASGQATPKYAMLVGLLITFN